MIKYHTMKGSKFISAVSVFEFLAFWRGGVTAKELGWFLGMSREAAQRSVVGRYKNEFPQATVIREGRTYIDGDAYSLKASPWKVADLINFTSAVHAFADAIGKESPLDVPIEDVVSSVDNEGEVEGVRALYGATAHRRTVYLDYRAKQGRIQLVFSPHAVVRTPMRIHFRGHAVWLSDNESRYIDVVPGRIIKGTLGGTDEYIGSANDVEWRQRTSIVAEINPLLPDEVKESVKQEYACDDLLVIEGVRKAVAHYVVDWLTGRRLRGVSEPIWRLSEKSLRKS